MADLRTLRAAIERVESVAVGEPLSADDYQALALVIHDLLTRFGKIEARVARCEGGAWWRRLAFWVKSLVWREGRS